MKILKLADWPSIGTLSCKEFLSELTRLGTCNSSDSRTVDISRETQDWEVKDEIDICDIWIAFSQQWAAGLTERGGLLASGKIVQYHFRQQKLYIGGRYIPKKSYKPL